MPMPLSLTQKWSREPIRLPPMTTAPRRPNLMIHRSLSDHGGHATDPSMHSANAE